MNNKKYTKTYKPFIAWFIGFIGFSIIIPKCFNLSEKIIVLIDLMVTVISLDILMLIIYKGEYVYWINGGPSYEEAKVAKSKVRKKYAKAHLDIFNNIILISFLYVIISLIFNFTIWIDILIISLIVVIGTFMTIPIKFDKKS